MNLFELVLLVWRRRYLVAFLILAFATTGVVVALRAKPVYRADVLLMPREAREEGLGQLSSVVAQLGGLASLTGLSGGVGGDSEESIAFLRSRQLAERFINQKELLPILFADRWDADANQWIASDVAPTMGDALKMFDERVRSVDRDAQSGLVTLRIDWGDRFLVAEWANEIVMLANDELRGREITEADRSLAFLNSALETASNVELRTAISGLMESQLQARTFASVRQDYAFRVIDPAIIPDANKRISPRRTVIVMAMTLAGATLALLLAGFLEYMARSRPA